MYTSKHQQIILIFILIFTYILITKSAMFVPNLNGACVIEQGDVNIAYLTTMTNPGKDDLLCSTELHSITIPQHLEVSF